MPHRQFMQIFVRFCWHRVSIGRSQKHAIAHFMFACNFKERFYPKKKNPNHRQPVVITTVVFIYFSRWDCMLMKNENKFTIFQATFVIIPGATENIAHWFCLFLIWNGRPFLFVCLFTRYTLVYSHPTTHSINSIILYHVETLSSIDVIIIAFNYSFRISAD